MPFAPSAVRSPFPFRAIRLFRGQYTLLKWTNLVHYPERPEKNLRRGQSAERATSFELTRQIVYISSIQARNPSTTSLQTRAAPGCSPTLLANLGQQEASKTVSARKIAQPYKCVPAHPATAARPFDHATSFTALFEPSDLPYPTPGSDSNTRMLLQHWLNCVTQRDTN